MDVMEFQKAKIGSEVRTHNLDVGKITSFGYLKNNAEKTQVHCRTNVSTANGAYVQMPKHCISSFYRYSELEFF